MSAHNMNMKRVMLTLPEFGKQSLYKANIFFNLFLFLLSVALREDSKPEASPAFLTIE